VIEQDRQQPGIDLDYVADVAEIDFVFHACLAVQDLFRRALFGVDDIAVDT
jgi:hypothetical protein